MSNPLLTLGSFSFEGLESPQKIQIKSKQRLAIHHLGSGLTTTDYLGDDSQVASFRGIFSGTNAGDRISSIDYLRRRGDPLALIWGPNALSVIIQKFELDYSSNLWVPYMLTCFVVRSAVSGMTILADATSASPVSQVSDMLSLLQNTNVDPTSGQTSALVTLTTLNYDTPPADALGQVQALVSLIDDQLATFGTVSQGDETSGGSFYGETNAISDMVANLRLQTALILARNRVMDAVVRAEGVYQQ
jgi:hypothetical protein